MTVEAGRIVVGVDGSAASSAALDWAVNEAELRGTGVQVVMAWQNANAYNAANLEAVGVTLDMSMELAGATKSEVTRLAEQAGRDSDVDVSAVAIEGHPAQALISTARDAALLVVGSRGHGGFVGALLGSVSQHVVAHAVCPVVVVPDPGRAAHERGETVAPA
jgi:nucleotide-binding universal stress UspA family protein